MDLKNKDTFIGQFLNRYNWSWKNLRQLELDHGNGPVFNLLD